MRSAVDYLVIGAGIVGITIARELKSREPSAKILILEKEPKLGMHSSGRNSGVLHSGIYYPPGTLKAQVCRQGSIEMADFHQEHNLRLNRLGKLLVVAQEEDAPQLNLLNDRASQHGISVEILDEQQLREAEPEARSATGQAIYVKDTAVGDPSAVLPILKREIEALGCEIQTGTEIVKVDLEKRVVKLKDGTTISYGHVVNAAGLHADQIAHQFDVGKRYTLLPFKGIYWKLDPGIDIRFNHLIYPVPDLRVPFLGVHTTTTVDGSTYLGPTAVPAFGRENYKGVQGVTLSELARILSLISLQFAKNRDGFRRLAWQEGCRYFKHWFAKAAQAIVPRIQAEHLLPTNKVGIRAQMFDRKEGKLVNDFLIERGENSTHILNAISPAWTSAFPFARHVCNHHIH